MAFGCDYNPHPCTTFIDESMNGDNINYILLNHSASGIDGMKLALLHYFSCNISYIHINVNIKYLIIHFTVMSYFFLNMQSH
jgi:hypothetical protein